ncbi:MAG: tetratricopeptide repeat protein [Rhodobacteraceae bacterium]|nr:tetratricopeptide repeat protein [Paracoccaceae bacterium]
MTLAHLGRSVGRTVSVLALAVALLSPLGLPVGPAAADTASGAFLAARQAISANDFRSAATFYTRALIRDPSNAGLMESAVLAHLAMGDVARALPIATRMAALGGNTQVENLALIADMSAREDWPALLAHLDGQERVGPLVDQLVAAWASVGDGRMSDAIARFDAMAQADGLTAFALYHKALALALAGDLEGADAILSGSTGTPIQAGRRGSIAHAQILSQLDRPAEALEVLRVAFGDDPDPSIVAIADQLAAGSPVPFDTVTSARDGIAEVFDSVAGVLAAEASPAFTLLYARMALHLNPRNVEGALRTAALYEQLERWDFATEVYNLIPAGHPAAHAAELGRAEALRRSGRTEAAIEALQALARTRGDLPMVHITLGDALRIAERHAEATAAYDRAVDLIGEPGAEDWFVFFARGITLERTDRWDEAEADFRRALELNPDQPQVLNYLGYSLVEQRRNLEEALSMIERAVAARPEDGYITDSLGWALYRMGRYDEAVGPMERAVELAPVDPVITDHLGDVYWMVGRRVEARFQWTRALSFLTPEDEDHEANPARIRRKLDVGLDVVKAEEAGQPVEVSNDGN